MLSRHAAGLMVTERNWLDVYPYTSWGGNADLPVFTEGQKFMPTTLMLKEVNLIIHAGGHAVWYSCLLPL